MSTELVSLLCSAAAKLHQTESKHYNCLLKSIHTCSFLYLKSRHTQLNRLIDLPATQLQRIDQQRKRNKLGVCRANYCCQEMCLTNAVATFAVFKNSQDLQPDIQTLSGQITALLLWQRKIINNLPESCNVCFTPAVGVSHSLTTTHTHKPEEEIHCRSITLTNLLLGVGQIKDKQIKHYLRWALKDSSVFQILF